MDLGESGGSAARETRRSLRARLGRARVLEVQDVYQSDGLWVSRTTTEDAGVYWIITESDILYPEDAEAMAEASVKYLGVNCWRKRVVESEFFAHPHPLFPCSSSFRVHLVHSDARPEWGLIERIARLPSSEYYALGEPSRAVREMPQAV
jgi:hypothetical protein